MFSKKITLLSLFLSFCSPFFANNKNSEDFHFSLSFLSGVKYGEITKSLYYNYLNRRAKVSQLDWKEEPIFELGAETEIEIKNVFLNAKASFGLPGNCGKMYDSDWNLSDTKTIFSVHENDLVMSFDTEIFLGYKTPSFSIFQINPAIGIKYMYQDFHAHNGYGWYGEAQYAKVYRDYDVAWNDPLARKAKLLRDIDYFRHTVLTFFGFEVKISPFEKNNKYKYGKFDFSVSYYISPFSHMYSIDAHHHESSKTHYLDTQDSFFTKHKLGFNARYFFNKNLSLTFDFSFIFGKDDFGDLYTDEFVVWGEDPDKMRKSKNQPTSSNVSNMDFDLKLTYHFK